MNTASVSGSCSACATRSAAINSGTPESLKTTASVGPARKSMAQSNETSFFATVTYAFPGPTILSTLGILLVPYAKAAIACAPPTR